MDNILKWALEMNISMLTKALTMVTMVETVTLVVEITATLDQDVTEDLMEVEEDRDLTVMLEEEQEMMSQDISLITMLWHQELVENTITSVDGIVVEEVEEWWSMVMVQKLVNTRVKDMEEEDTDTVVEDQTWIMETRELSSWRLVLDLL